MARLIGWRIARIQRRTRLAVVRAVAAARRLGVRVLVIARRTAKVALAVVVVSVLLGGSAFAASSLYGGYGSPREPASQRAWADRQLRYGLGDCANCHATEVAVAAGSAHAIISCELCHAPTAAHPGEVANVIAALPASDSSTCVACHSGEPGRPAGLPQVELVAHYPLVDCLRCHDPHSAVAIAPPEVTHPLEKLPACTTCHSPTGLKRFPEGHQPAADTVCLACHRPGWSER